LMRFTGGVRDRKGIWSKLLPRTSKVSLYMQACPSLCNAGVHDVKRPLSYSNL